MDKALNRPPPFFVGDHPAMDFLNSIASPQGTPIEWLASGSDLIDWLQQAKLIDEAAVRPFRTGSAREIDMAAKAARALREWLRGFVGQHMGKALRPNAVAELEDLNRLLAGGEVYYEIERVTGAADREEGNGLALRRKQRWSKPAQLLQPVALAIGDLVCHADFRLIRRCEGPACTVMFYDRTKSHARRWCSMSACGNRAKVAAFRARQK